MTIQDEGMCSSSQTQTARAHFTVFYESEFMDQFRRARLLVGSSERAADVVHDAFVAVWSRWENLDDPGPYLNRCVVNGAMSTHRNTSRLRHVVDRLRSTTVTSTDGDPEFLNDVLQRLPVKQRAAIVLRYYAGLSDVEIAAAMGRPTGSVGPWISRALEQLRKELT